MDKKLIEILSGLEGALSNNMDMFNDEVLASLLDFDYLQTLCLPRIEMLRRFTKNGIDYHVIFPIRYRARVPVLLKPFH